jgi:hypothetical protein
VVLASFAIGLWAVERSQAKTPVRLAGAVLETCKSAGYKPNCYEKEIPKLMDKISMEDAFEVTRLVQDADPSFLYCHVLAHDLSFKESKKNPQDWKNILNRCPKAMCNYGCLHGSLIEHFRGDVLTETQLQEAIPVLSEVCEPRDGFVPTEIDRTMCYHAIGHLAMYITDGKPDRAIPICQQVSVKEDGRTYTATCVEGAFMTVFQGVDPEDIALVAEIKPGKDSVAAFCQRYGGEEFWQACRRESYPLFRQELNSAPGIGSFCAYATDAEARRNCISAAVNVFTDTAFSGSNGLAEADRLCGAFVGEDRASCYITVAQRLVQIEPLRHAATANEVCAHASQRGVGERCYEGLVYYASFSFAAGSQEMKTYCGALPAPWRDACQQGQTP